jgi:predicted PurR-regulated permease PerM
MTKRVMWLGTAVMTTLLALLLLWQFRTAVLYVLVSLALAAAARSLAKRRAGQSLVSRLVVISVALIALGIVGFLLFLAISAALRDIQELVQQVSVQNEWRQPQWLVGSSFQQLLDTRLPSPSELFAAVIGDEGQLVLPAVLGFTQGIISTVSSILVVLFLSLYWSTDQIHFERLWLSLLPPVHRTRARDIWRTIELDIGAYIRSEAAQSLLAGLLLGLGYWLLGSPYPALLALIGALAWLIPVMGTVLVIIAPLLIGLLTGVPLSLLTVLYTLIVLIVLEVWIVPRLSKSRQVNPILTVIILIALADAYGLLGIVIAPPLSAVCQILWRHLVSHRVVAETATQVSDLKERQTQLWPTIQAMDDPPPLIISSMERLTQLLDKAETAGLVTPEPSGLPTLSPPSPLKQTQNVTHLPQVAETNIP